jgi:hypothetical protein
MRRPRCVSCMPYQGTSRCILSVLSITVIVLLDSGASHSSLSRSFVRANINGVPYRRHANSQSQVCRVTLADGREVPVPTMPGTFRTKHSLYVLDECDYDCVLGMDVLVAHEPVVHWCRRWLTFGETAETMQALRESKPRSVPLGNIC